MIRPLRSTLLWAALLASSAALASHYPLSEIPGLATASQVASLNQQGITTSEELWKRAAKAKDRRALAESIGKPPAGAPRAKGERPAEAAISACEAWILELARRCDLLRVRGIGPEMVLLLRAAGVHNIAELAASEPASLLAAATAANQAPRITGKLPTEPQVAHWVSEARKLPVVLEDPARPARGRESQRTF